MAIRAEPRRLLMRRRQALEDKQPTRLHLRAKQDRQAPSRRALSPVDMPAGWQKNAEDYLAMSPAESQSESPIRKKGHRIVN
eukprot:41619-Eustigmatos_ZCMA.PRE.1